MRRGWGMSMLSARAVLDCGSCGGGVVDGTLVHWIV
jgi:hypothetical protein